MRQIKSLLLFNSIHIPLPAFQHWVKLLLAG
jgi:hypothetical protein